MLRSHRLRKDEDPLRLAAGLAVSSPALAADMVDQAPPPAPFQKVSSLAKLPDFIPGIGDLYVDPSTLPAGPFLAYDHEGNLVSTIYMIPIADLQANKTFDDLPAPGGSVDHVDIYFNAGHPGVEVPHAHVVLWHAPASSEELVAK